ncbi:hypothetical protein BSKO_05907 [Bryopsis sp. KO-2023]|nr:hypothetical protein BSKO_05907 [Bryopsis sp. KO-2023]
MAGPAEGHLYVDVNVITEEDLERASLDLHCLEVMAPDRKVFSYRMHKHESIGDVRRKGFRDIPRCTQALALVETTKSDEAFTESPARKQVA